MLLICNTSIAQGFIYLSPDTADNFIIDGMQPHDNGGFVYSCRKCPIGCTGVEDDTIRFYRKSLSGPPVEICKRLSDSWFPIDWEPQHLTKWNDGFLYMSNTNFFELLIYKLDSSGMIYDSLVFVDSVAKIPSIIIRTSDGGAILGGSDWFNIDRSWVVKLDSNLNVEWTRYFPTSNSIPIGFTTMPFLEETPDSGFVWSWAGDSLTKINAGGAVLWSRSIGPSVGIYDMEVSSTGEISLLIYADTAAISFPASSGMGILKLNSSGVSIDSMVVNPCGYLDVYSYKLRVLPNGNYWIIESDFDYKSITVQVLDSQGYVLNVNRNYLDIYASLWGRPEQTSDGGLAIHGRSDRGNSGTFQGLIVKIDSSGLIFPNLITGKIHDDPDGDCIYDTGENNLDGWFVEISEPSRNYIVTTDSVGEYKLSLPAGNYTVTQVQHANRTAICPASPNNYLVNFGPGQNVSANNDFSNQLIPGVQDVSVSFSNVTPIRLAQQVTFEITYRNNGSIPMNGYVYLTYPAQLTYDSSSEVTSSHVSNTVAWNYTNLQYDEFGNIFVYFYVPLSFSLGDSLSFSLTISPIGGDGHLADNYLTWNGIIVGSFDPNEKHVEPSGWGTEGYIFAGTPLTYTIFFQNTGNDTALNISIVDQLDSSLDWTSFTFVAASHACTYTLETNGRLTFHLNNIMLPDSFINEPQSHGFVKFSINQNPIVAPGTEITNTAAIYFDANAAVITNTTLNTIADPNGIFEGTLGGPSVTVFPNPANDVFTIQIPEEVSGKEVYFELYDVCGRQIMNEQLVQNEETFSRKDIGAGAYLYMIVVDGTRTATGNLIFE